MVLGQFRHDMRALYSFMVLAEINIFHCSYPGLFIYWANEARLSLTSLNRDFGIYIYLLQL